MTKIKCKECGDIIQGDMKGTLIWCKCGNCFIDETEHYARVCAKDLNTIEKLEE